VAATEAVLNSLLWAEAIEDEIDDPKIVHLLQMIGYNRHITAAL